MRSKEHTMKVDDDFQITGARPLDCLVEVRKLALVVWFSSSHLPRPEADGDADMVKPLRVQS